jgi:hypothetical protein
MEDANGLHAGKNGWWVVRTKQKKDNERALGALS